MKGDAGRRGNAENTYLVVECGNLLLAFHSLRVERALLNEGVNVMKSPHDPTKAGEKPRCPPVAVLGDQTWVAWDLGLILRQETAPRSWVLFQVPYNGRTLQMGLRAGVCVAVGSILRRSPLPAGMLERRGGAFRSAFVVDEESRIGPAHMGRLGLIVDERKLWTAAELQVSCAALGLEPLREEAWA